MSMPARKPVRVQTSIITEQVTITIDTTLIKQTSDFESPERHLQLWAEMVSFI